MKTFRVCLVTFFCLSFLHISLKAKEADHARLKLPWEIIKGMLKIDQDEVQLTWDEFQTLLQHTVQKKVWI